MTRKIFAILFIILLCFISAVSLGEFYFSEYDLPNTFLMVTLGTGIGGAAVIDGKLFNGGNGNGVEVGHMLADKDSVYEDYISKRALVAYALDKLEKSDKYEDSVLAKIPADELTAKDIEAALKEKDKQLSYLHLQLK